jgi:hypothetical protein
MVPITNYLPISIKTLFDGPESEDGTINQYYRDIVLFTLRKILPSEFFEQRGEREEILTQQKKIFQRSLPIITCSEARIFPGKISFFALSKFRPNSFKFFFEMISRWLVPGKRLNVVLVYATDLRLTDLSDQIYTLCEVMISVENMSEFEVIQRHFPIIGTEIVLGLESAFYAQRILEIKGLSADEKTALIQGFMAFLIKKFPHAYGDDLFIEMQHALVTFRDEFKASRQVRHLSRMISVQYLFRKSLRESVKKHPNRRYVSLKMFRAYIKNGSGGRKKVLAILVGMNFLRDQETFGEKHLLKTLQHYIPSAQAIDQSFFVNKLASENVGTFYLEIEKKDGTDFTTAEIRKLRRDLPPNLKNRIEHKQHPVFMPRNEEEVIRNILALSSQIKYLRDIPQVFISFDEQAHSHLLFTIILARVVKSDSQPIVEMFKKVHPSFEYLHDRTKIVGYIRKKYAKEATVFRLKVSKENFLRADHSIDLYKARQTVVDEVSRVMGEIRDYNGGMISKQHELLSDIRCLLVDIKDYDELLLENFFYSLSPVVVRALLEPKAFRTLFLMLLEGIKDHKQEECYVKFYSEPYNVFSVVVTEDSQVKDLLHHVVHDLHIPPTELAIASVKANNFTCIGYICCAKDPLKKERLFTVIEQTIQQIENKVHS